VERNYRSVARLRVRQAAERTRESLFVLPAGILVLGIALAQAAGYVDRHLDDRQVPTLVLMSRDAAITLLGTVAGATITTSGVVFSIMVVSVQLASGQFSPRVVRRFFRDRVAQAVIGLLVAAFAVSVSTLQQMHDSGRSPDADVPVVSIGLTLLLALLGVFAIVGFLDRSARGLYVGNIVDRVAQEAIEVLDDLDDAGLTPTTRRLDDAGLRALGRPVTVRSAQDGWVQQVDAAAVLRAAPPGSVVRVETRVGSFLVEGQAVAAVWLPRDRDPAVAPAEPAELADRVRDAFVIGGHRTMQQDVDFGLRQLNDIALRALSPAVNDPTTAIEAVLRVGSVLRRLLLADLPAQARTDAAGSLLLTPADLDHGEYVRHAYGQVRLVATAHPAVASAMLRSMRMLVELVEREGHPERAEPLRAEMRLLLDGVDAAGLLPADVATVRAAAEPAPLDRLLGQESSPNRS